MKNDKSIPPFMPDIWTTFLLMSLSLSLSLSLLGVQTVCAGEYILLENTLKLRPQFTLGSDRFENETDQSNIIRTTLDVDSEMKINDYFSVALEGSLIWSTGRAQGWYAGDAMSNGVRVSKAYIDLHFPLGAPNFQAQLLGGVINTDFMQMPLLMGSLPFPGVQGSLWGQIDSFGFKISGLYAMPTSSSFDSDRAEKEETPILKQASAEFRFGVSTHFAHAQAGYYSFDYLPSKVAYDSGFKGNSVSGDFESSSFFNYYYYGPYFKVGYSFLPSLGLGVDVSYSVHKNTDAPEGENRGERIYAKIPLSFSGDLAQVYRVSLNGEIFHNERNSSVGNYSSSRYGNNNRQGFSAGFSFESLKQYVASISYTNANLIEVIDDRQTNQSLVSVKFSLMF